MTIDHAVPCRSCGGRGWKLLTFRRSHDRLCGTAEQAPAARIRAVCLACQPPSGRQQDAGQRSGHEQ